MKNTIKWHKGFFSQSYQIYDANGPLGKLINRNFSRTSSGEISGLQFSFVTKGFFNQYSLVYDSENKEVGKITFGSWMNKATITLRGTDYNWKNDNCWGRSWTIQGKGLTVTGAQSQTAGTISTDDDDLLLCLCGLYVMNTLKQMSTVVLVAVFVPIWIAVIQ